MPTSSEPAVHIALVEEAPDRSGSLSAFSASLEREGVLLEGFPDLDPAVKRISRGGVDGLILDLDRSEGGGAPLVERAVAFVPDLPLLVISSAVDPELAIHSLQEGAQDHLHREELTPAVLTRAVRYALERHRLVSALRSLSVIDPLTGLYNRRGFLDLGEQHLRLARRSGRGLSLLYCDVDRFKEINDSQGHIAGDRALKALTRLLRSSFRRSDLLGRLGGDEFAILAVEVEAENAALLPARIHGRLAAFNAEGTGSIPLSVSIGMARHVGAGSASLMELLGRADAAMYRDKKSRRGGHEASGRGSRDRPFQPGVLTQTRCSHPRGTSSRPEDAVRGRLTHVPRGSRFPGCRNRLRRGRSESSAGERRSPC